MGLGKSRWPEVSNDTLSRGRFKLIPALVRKRDEEPESGMCPRLGNPSLALHANEQHRAVHTRLVNVLRSILMKNQGSIIKHFLASLTRGNLVSPST